MVSLGFAQQYKDSQLRDICTKVMSIKQGYLAFSKGMTTRIRCIDNGDKNKWFLTFKQKVNDRVIEIEKKLDDRDGSDLWQACVGKLTKDRYVFAGEEIWEVDLFKRSGELYFILAEVELAEGKPRPKSVPKFLKPYVLYEVPITDDRFSNKRLGDVDYAMNLYKSLS